MAAKEKIEQTEYKLSPRSTHESSLFFLHLVHKSRMAILHGLLVFHTDRLGVLALGSDLLVTLQAQLGPSTGASLTLTGEAQGTAGVDEELGRVELGGDTVLRRGIVEGVLVVPVVPALAHGHQGHGRVLGGPDRRVIRTITEKVSSRVHQPGEVQHTDVSQGTSSPVAVPEVVAPKHADQAGEDEAHKQVDPGIQPLLEHHHGVLKKVIEGQLLSSLNNILVLLHKQPSNVGKEESALGIVRVSVSLQEEKDFQTG